MSLAGKIGRRGRVIAMEEDTYGTLQTPLATGALRHLDIGMSYNPFNFTESQEKKQSPGLVNELAMRATAGFDLKSAYLIPSGALNTAPEANLFLKHGIGSSRSVTLSTTFSGDGDEVSGTLTSATGLQVGDMILIGLGSDLYVRRIATLDTLDITWDLPLPSGVSSGDTVKGGITYSLISGEATKGLSIFHYVDTIKRAVTGAVIDALTLTFNANDAYKFSASGPAVEQIAAGSIAAIPGFTTVGAKPITGISGRFEVGAADLSDVTAYKALKVGVDLKNGYVIRNESLGYSKGEEFYRDGRRSVGLSLDARVEDPTVIYDNAMTGTPVPVQIMAGLTAGKIFVVYAPKARFDVPDTPDGDGALTWSFTAKCLESADGANDEIIVGAF